MKGPSAKEGYSPSHSAHGADCHYSHHTSTQRHGPGKARQDSLLKRATSLQHCFYTWKVLTLQTVIIPVVLTELVFIYPSPVFSLYGLCGHKATLNLNRCLEFGLLWSLLSGDREKRGRSDYIASSPLPDSETTVGYYDWWAWWWIWWDTSGYDSSYDICPEVDEDLCYCQDYCYITYGWDGSVYRVNLKS